MTPLTDERVERFDAEGMQTVFAIMPFGASETRAERIARLEKLGMIAPDCAYCREAYSHPTLNAFMPQHTASPRCRSGKRNHCSCDSCF